MVKLMHLHKLEDAETEPETPSSGQRQYSSLDEALRIHRIPWENDDVIRRITDGIGVCGYFGTSGYIRAVRGDGGPDLRIAYGYTNGFQSAEEANRILGEDARPWRSKRRGLWGVLHRLEKTRDGGTNAGRGPRGDGGECVNCGNRLPMSGICSFCE